MRKLNNYAVSIGYIDNSFDIERFDNALRETYDSARLEELNLKKERHKSIEYSNKLSIKNLEQNDPKLLIYWRFLPLNGLIPSDF